MTNPENNAPLEPLEVAGKYYETLPLDANAIADGTTLALCGGRCCGQWALNIRDFSGLTHIPDDEHMPPQIGEIVTETDPYGLDSAQSYEFAHAMAADWLARRGLRIVRDIPGARLAGMIVGSTYVVSKPSLNR